MTSCRQVEDVLTMDNTSNEEPDTPVEKKALGRKSSYPGVISSPPSITGSPRHHRSPRRTASERRKSRHHHHHHHHHHVERKGSVMASTSRGTEARRTSRVGDRRVSHALDQSPQSHSRTNSISDHRKLSATDSTSLPITQRKQSERQQGNGPYMSPGLNMAGSYGTPGAEIIVASLIIAVGLVTLLVSFATGTRIWMIVGSVCLALGGMFLILGLCWYCAKVKDKPEDEETELRVITNEEIRAKLLHHHSGSVRNGKGPANV